MRTLPSIAVLTAAAALLTSCGGGPVSISGNNGVSEASGEQKQGHILDSGVAGMQYQSGSLSGTTDADGGFMFVTGQPVVFRIHDIDVMTVSPESVTTPADAASNGAADNQEAVNIARFLQSLDSDNDVNNGIQLNVAEADTNGIVINFDVPTDSFTSGAGAQFVNGQGKSLKAAGPALQHLQETIAFFDDEDGIKLDPTIFELTAGQSKTVTITAPNAAIGFNFRSDNNAVMAEAIGNNQFTVSALASATDSRVTVEADLEFDGGATATKAIIVRVSADESPTGDNCMAGDPACDPDACPVENPPPCDGTDPEPETCEDGSAPPCDGTGNPDPEEPNCTTGDPACDTGACPAENPPPCDGTDPGSDPSTDPGGPGAP